MQLLIADFLNDESGATAIEYGLVVSLISVAIIGALLSIGVNLVAKFQDVIDALFGVR